MAGIKRFPCGVGILGFTVALVCCGWPLTAALAQDKPDRDQNPLQLRPMQLVEPGLARSSDLADLSGPPGAFGFESFIEMVDRHYPKLQSADAERRIAGAKRLEKAGAFDPVLNGVNEYLRVQDIVNPGKAKQAIHNEAQVDLLTRSGIKLFTGMRLNPNDTKTPLLPSGRAGEYYGGMSVPLLRGFIQNEKNVAEKQAKLGEPLAAQLYKLTRLELLLKAAATYWECIGARSRIDVAQNLLKIAETRVGQIKERVAKGDSPALEIAEAEQEIQRRQAALIKTEREFQKACLSLSVFFWDENGVPKAIPKDSLPALSPSPRRLTDSEWFDGRRKAIELRPELKKINLEREQVKVELKLAQNMLLPAMNLYYMQGADTGPQGIGLVMRAGVNVSAPLRQRTARGQIEAARLKIEKLNFDEKAEKQRIQAEVDDTVSAINTSYDRFAATEQEVKKAKDVEAGERLRYGAGDSTLFLVNQRERTTAEAQMRLLETHVEYLQALSAFKAVTCRL